LIARRPTGAFTLLELLSVVAIILVLAAILFPFARKMVDRAHTAQCISNLRAIGIGLQSYAADNNSNLPIALWGDSGSAPATLITAGGPNGLGLLVAGGYLGDPPRADVTGVNRPKVLMCPSKNGRFFFSDPGWSSYAYQSPSTTGSGAADLAKQQKNLIPGGWALAMDACQAYRNFDAAHEGKFSNVLYADGHVESRPFIGAEKTPGWGVWLGMFDLKDPRQ